MNEALISIGSNDDKEANVALCRQLLCNHFSTIAFSDSSITVPYGIHYKNDFLNQLAIVYTDKSQDDVCMLLKQLEVTMGRSPLDKKEGLVRIDIDLIIWNEEVIKPDDLQRTYVADLIPSLYR